MGSIIAIGLGLFLILVAGVLIMLGIDDLVKGKR